jgi:serine phosphatase RsbU (regulator of sigma subunit)
VKTFPGGVLIAAIDGLGHGEPAPKAALTAVQALEEQPSDAVDAQLRRCHDRLKRTRGVVMSVARIDEPRSELTWSGVGNVEGLLLRVDPLAKPRRHSLLVFGGVVGGVLAGIRTAALPLNRGDVLVFATDGVQPDFSDELELFGAPQTTAPRALARWRRGDDDALVLVVRWLGGGP